LVEAKKTKLNVMENKPEKVIFKLSSELAYFKLISFLESNQIWYTARKVENNLYPSLNVGGLYGEITVLQTDSELTTHFLENQEYTETDLLSEMEESKLPAENATASPSKPKKNRTQTYLIIYSVIITLVALRYGYLNTNYQEDKHYKYEWNVDATAVYTIFKKKSEIITASYDGNYDLNFEKSIGYSNGYKVSESFDTNENGIFERVNYYNKKGELAGYSINVDEDFCFEQSCTILSNKDTLYFMDKDRDCMFDAVQIAPYKK